MKILILSDDFPPESKGGADKVAFNLANGFCKKGHQVFVVTNTQDKKKEKLGINFEGMKVYRIYLPCYHERWKAYLSLYNPKAVGKLKDVLQDTRPDIVHVHNIHYYFSYYSLRIAKKYSKAVFLTVHDVMLFNYRKLATKKYTEKFDCRTNWWDHLKQAQKRYNPLRNIVIHYYLKYVDKIFAVSNALKEALNQNGIQNVEVIHNGIDVENWQIEQEKIKEFKNKFDLQNKKIVLFGGRLSGLKGGGKIIEAMDLVSKEMPEAVLLVLGKKDHYAQQMKQLAREKDVNLILTDWIEKDELKSAYWSSDIVVTPSLCLDTFNLMNLEAMVCHKPVLGTCFGGTPEIVQDGETGYIVNPFNIELMAEKILDLLTNSQKAKQFGEIGYQRVKKGFSLEKQVEAYLKWFKKS